MPGESVDAYAQFWIKMTCGQCLAFVPQNDHQGVCRRHPPQIIVVGAKKVGGSTLHLPTGERRDGIDAVEYQSFYPPMGVNHPACFDFVFIPGEEAEA